MWACGCLMAVLKLLTGKRYDYLVRLNVLSNGNEDALAQTPDILEAAVIRQNQMPGRRVLKKFAPLCGDLFKKMFIK